MRTHVKGMLEYFRHRSLTGMIIQENGNMLSNHEARAFLKLCIKHNIEFIEDAPEFDINTLQFVQTQLPKQ